MLKTDISFKVSSYSIKILAEYISSSQRSHKGKSHGVNEKLLLQQDMLVDFF